MLAFHYSETITLKMKYHKLIFLIILVSLVSCNNKKVYITEEDLNSDMLCLRGEMEPYSGTCYILSKNTGSISHKFIYKNGKLHGKAINFYDNGNIKSQGYYDNNNMVDTWEFRNEQGNKIYMVNFRNDSLNGEFISYYLNGKVKVEGTYLNNTRMGDWTYYDKNGQVIRKVSY
jgi:antitoxin component YwqK of YwqJK toxin-antitoxin module